MTIYGGDEVSAIVLDIGTSTTRAGYAGDDCPRSVVPTSYGYIPGKPGDPTNPDSSEEQPARYYLGSSSDVYRPYQEIRNPLNDSIVEDWSAAERLMEHSLKDQLATSSLNENPLLVSEPSWNSRENRERMIELAFESWDSNAYFSVDRAVLSAFANGKGTALVVDIGESSSNVFPVYDGFVLRKGIQRSPIGGAVLNDLIITSLNEAQPPVNITPTYLVKSKSPVEPGQSAKAELREERLAEKLDEQGKARTTPSWHQNALNFVASDFRESICQVYDQPWSDSGVMTHGQRPFEFPDGFNTYFGPQPRLTVPEVLFNPARFLPQKYSTMEVPTNNASTIPLPNYQQAPSISQMIINSVNQLDPEILPHMLQNIVVVGGTSLTPGLVDRINAEMTALAPGHKVKITAPGTSVERKFSSWLGGSILSSLGTFHQLWIGREEYMEHGRSIIHKRAR